MWKFRINQIILNVPGCYSDITLATLGIKVWKIGILNFLISYKNVCGYIVLWKFGVKIHNFGFWSDEPLNMALLVLQSIRAMDDRDHKRWGEKVYYRKVHLMLLFLHFLNVCQIIVSTFYNLLFFFTCCVYKDHKFMIEF